ncbi:MAG: hypothetical protein ACYS22_16865 [Planctomycetota bacterium]
MSAISNNPSGIKTAAIDSDGIHPLANWSLLLLLAAVTLAAIGLG